MQSFTIWQAKRSASTPSPRPSSASSRTRPSSTQAVKNYLANQRQGTQSALTKGEVSYTTKKPWRQKGTGRARAGYAGSPVWRHGGVAFAPKPRDYRYSLTKKTRRLALKSALSAKAAENAVLVVDGLTVETAKTKPFAEFLKKIGAEGKAMVITENVDSNVVLSARNIPGVDHHHRHHHLRL